MPISAVSSPAVAFYQPVFDGSAAFAPPPDTGASQTSSIVTLGNAQGSSVTPMSTASLSSMSLSEAWAPQMHVQADADHDNLLSASEFEAQMKRVGIDAAQAQEMFRNFDKSGDGHISVEEYVAGVKASNSSGSMLFNKLLDTYVRGADGKIDDQAETDFLSKGSAAAEKYWGGRR
ncbi:hypothetical protein D9O50_16905 [Oxalobacteraceae bacterium CAVE-383]|nr:hypothetical protein D9O50_16905 [Oxalobacteraceae bacterium CAVE-383]